MAEPEQKTIGTFYCNGSDPADGGWVFDDGGENVDGHTMAYETNSRDEAIEVGVPTSVLDRFEADGGVYDSTDGGGLFDWLQEHSELFHCVG